MTGSSCDESVDEGKRQDARLPLGDVRVLRSRELFAGRTEVCIEHDGSIYRLKLTRQNKLILNK